VEKPDPGVKPSAEAASVPVPGPPVTRDQRRALFAYKAVSEVSAGDRPDYKAAVEGLAANVLRNGLSAALAAVERLGRRGELLLEHLAAGGLPGLEGVTGRELPDRVRRMNVDAYMLATREMLQVAAWLKRAVQATFEDD